jgi:hypothetical protein
MAESQSGFDMSEYEREQDSMLAGVMPSTWLGHGRLVINERELSDKKRNFAQRLLDRLAEKYPNQPTDKLAEKAVETTEEKLD